MLVNIKDVVEICELTVQLRVGVVFAHQSLFTFLAGGIAVD
jgi:hypothetical protein